MESGKIKAIRTFYEGLNKENFKAKVEHLDPEFEWDMSRSRNPDLKGVHRGREEVGKLLASFVETWDDIEWVVEEYIEVGDKVVTVGGPHGRGRGGVEVSATGGQVWEFRDDVPTAIRACQTKEEALQLAQS